MNNEPFEREPMNNEPLNASQSTVNRVIVVAVAVTVYRP